MRAKKLQVLLANEQVFESVDTLEDALYDVYGDDNLYDRLAGLQGKENISKSARRIIANEVKKMLGHLRDSPDDFFVDFSDSAVDILNQIVSTYL